MTGDSSNADLVRTVERRGSGQAVVDSQPNNPGSITDAQIPSTIARDTEVTAAIAAHVALGDPHTQYVVEGGTLAAVGTSPPANGVIAALTFTAVPTGAECEALRDQCEILRDSLAAAIATIETLRVHA